jgi:hypothetical protein
MTDPNPKRQQGLFSMSFWAFLLLDLEGWFFIYFGFMVFVLLASTREEASKASWLP